MLRARTNTGLIILGLDATNIEKLKAGFPINIDLATVGGQGDLVIMYGETLGDVQKELEKVTGQKMPPPMPFNPPGRPN